MISKEINEIKTNIRLFELLNEILKEILRINKIKGLDAFFSLSGHVDSITIMINKDATYREDEVVNHLVYTSIYLDNQKGLEQLLKDLNDIK